MKPDTCYDCVCRYVCIYRQTIADEIQRAGGRDVFREWTLIWRDVQEALAFRCRHYQVEEKV